MNRLRTIWAASVASAERPTGAQLTVGLDLGRVFSSSPPAYDSMTNEGETI